MEYYRRLIAIPVHYDISILEFQKKSTPYKFCTSLWFYTNSVHSPQTLFILKEFGEKYLIRSVCFPAQSTSYCLICVEKLPRKQDKLIHWFL